MNPTSELTMYEIFNRGRRSDISKLLLQEDLENTETQIMPEIKISFEGRKLFANVSADKFLERLGVKDLEQKFFSGKYPHILKPGINEDFEINSGPLVFCFTAVAFDEAEYIGLYCYRIIRNKINIIH